MTTSRAVTYTQVAIQTSLKRLPKKIHFAAEVNPRSGSKPGRIGRTLCGGGLAVDEEAFNAERTAYRAQEPIAFSERPICESCVELRYRCTKRSYPDQVAAYAAIEALRDKRSAEQSERRAYYCERHDAWHLTSQPKGSA